jgi:hypothetical protein
MNESEFEEQLRAIHPAAPRRAVEERIAAELAVAPAVGTLPRARRSWLERLLPGLGWCAIGATAGIATMLAMDFTHDPRQVDANKIAPQLAAAAEAEEELENELLGVADAGLIEGNDDGVARVVRYESLERRRWVGEDGAVTVLEVPREDLVFVPVTFQ